ncbi:MAG: ABC transporter ATP-binding protein [Cetobacterium sp.]|uniref:ABC transporter ATP-binding protein n=1 Tax=Cetobacterium sp. TaxID=2071632 RepID=UPI003F3041BC
MINVVEFKDFTFKYMNQSEPNLKNINLEIKKGEKVLIAGPSGSGKSTLGSCLNGIIPFSKEGGFKGTCTVNGIEPYETSIFEISKHVGTVLQDQDGQFIGLSVGEDVSFIDENNLVDQDIMIKSTKDVLTTIGMQAFINHSPQELSGGQKQSVSLAGIMRSPADILLFDEPLANLDPYSGKHAMKLISDIQKTTQKTIIVIEHRIEDVLEQNFDRVIIINKGEVVANGTPEELFRKNLFRKYGLREPLFIEALKYSGINLEKDSIYPIEKIATSENIEKIKTWCDSIEIKKTDFKEKILEVKNLFFSYTEDKPILKDVSFSVNKGEILALLGNNGAGKSTLCKVITGIENETSGDIILLNKSIVKDSIKRRGEKIGFVMQNPNHMITQETLAAEVEFGLRIRGVKNYAEKAEKALEVCGLHEFRHWPVTSLSYGQKKRLTIAAILALQPEVLILDEPTAGQDYKRYKDFMKFVKEIARNGVAIILITHDMHLALEYANRAVVLCNGTLVANDPPSVILGKTDLMEKSNLKETSLSHMADLMGLDSEKLMNSFINFENIGGTK